MGIPGGMPGVMNLLATADGCFGVWMGSLFVAGALYAALSVGVTGGPNKGEHPFTVTVIHLVLFFVLARTWPWGPWWGYLGLLLATLVAAVLAMGLTRERRAWVLWSGRGVMLGLHAAMFAIAFRVA